MNIRNAACCFLQERRFCLCIPRWQGTDIVGFVCLGIAYLPILDTVERCACDNGWFGRWGGRKASKSWGVDSVAPTVCCFWSASSVRSSSSNPSKSAAVLSLASSVPVSCPFREDRGFCCSCATSFRHHSRSAYPRVEPCRLTPIRHRVFTQGKSGNVLQHRLLFGFRLAQHGQGA